MGHHYVPRQYLRGFAKPPNVEGLWQFDKQTGKFSDDVCAIAAIAQERGFYDDETEQQLSLLIEGPGNRVLKKLRSGDLDLDDQDRADLAAYISTTMRRVPRHRTKGRAVAPQALADVVADVRREIEAAAAAGYISAELAAKRLAETDAAEAKYGAAIPPNVLEELYSPWPSSQMIAMVQEMHWRFIQAGEGATYITSDNPAFIFECYGLATDLSELTFPIGSELALFGSHTPIRKRKTKNRIGFLVKEANRRVISGAERFVYCNEPADWIADVAMKANPYLSRIVW